MPTKYNENIYKSLDLIERILMKMEAELDQDANKQKNLFESKNTNFNLSY